MSERVIPVVDLSKFLEGSSTQRNEFVQELGDAFHQIGFVGVKKHGISQDLINDFYMSSKAFFGLPKSDKNEYEIKGLAGQRGYTSFGKEHAKGSDAPDLKEFFQFGQEIDADHPLKKYIYDKLFFETLSVEHLFLDLVKKLDNTLDELLHYYDYKLIYKGYYHEI